ncbi:MAG: RcpC/CpaB family pilus assembly protein [Thermaerobacter sp.]|jgi:Flp pilus assembly protein CpaB|nr:RcpC/CpaB family pilus assembly protein [Thermaerobacter sp.]
MRGKRILKFLAALVVAVVAAVLLLAHVARQEARIKLHPVVLVTRDVAAYAPLAAADLTVRDLPAEAFPQALSSIGAATGKAALVPLVAGQPLMTSDLSSTAIPRGWAVVGIQVDLAGSTGILQPGDIVVVVAPPANGTGSSAGNAAHVLAVGAKVLAVWSGQGTPVGDGTGTPSLAAGAAAGLPAAVTLMVPARDATAVAAASHANLSLIIAPWAKPQLQTAPKAGAKGVGKP